MIELGLSKAIVEAARKHLGIEEPTPVQRLAIPEILRGNNVLIISPSGTGKTEAALLPVLDLMLRHERIGIEALYITPLRALNRDIFWRMQRLAQDLGIKMEVRHGDTSDSVRRRQARAPPNILITTPETLQAILPGKIMKEHLRRVRYVIVDEVHELLDDKRGIQLLLALERLKELTNYDFQRIGLSATIGSPEVVAKYLQGSSRRRFKIINAPYVKKYELIVTYIRPTNVAKAGMPNDVYARLEHILSEVARRRATLIFTNTREMAELLGSRLRALDPNTMIMVHHGSLSRDERVKAETGLKRGELKAIVCTSSLELGIDIGHVEYVIQYSSPRRATSLIQRVGRAGHRVGGIAKGEILAINIDDILESAVLAKMAMAGELEQIEIHHGALDVLAHQIVGIVLDKGRVELQALFELIRRCAAYRDLPAEIMIEVVKQLEEEGKVRVRNDVILKTRSTWQYYYENLSMIPDVVDYKVIDITSDREIGTLDEEFIARYGREGTDFILSGYIWRILSVDHDERKVYVEPSYDLEAAIPAWVGELIPVPFRCSVEVGSLRRRIYQAISRGHDPDKVLSKYPLSKDAKEEVIKVFEEMVREEYIIGTDRTMLVEGLKDIVIVHSCIGSKGNYGLGLLLSYMLSNTLGSTVAFSSDAYRVLLKGAIPIRANDVLECLMKLSEENLLDMLKASSSNTEEFRWRLYHVAKRFGLLRREASISDFPRRLVRELKDTPVFKEALREFMLSKVDIHAIRWLLRRISRGLMNVVSIRSDKISPLTMPILMRAHCYDVMPSVKPTSLILNTIKERLLSNEVKLLCVKCLKWKAVRMVRYLPDRISCPICGSKLIAVMKPGDDRMERAIKAWRRGAKLSKEEKELVRRAQNTIKLLLLYGKRAIIALAGRGIGPQTAIRILRKADDEEQFYLEILKAERQYVQTRRFWD
ncbi:MAG: hypothetical protein DRM97_00250 [Thermoprotei archaeon]|nr:MAG: hypothetical protein DRM97_00250 [Thermoprotei archaeon]